MISLNIRHQNLQHSKCKCQIGSTVPNQICFASNMWETGINVWCTWINTFHKWDRVFNLVLFPATIERNWIVGTTQLAHFNPGFCFCKQRIWESLFSFNLRQPRLGLNLSLNTFQASPLKSMEFHRSNCGQDLALSLSAVCSVCLWTGPPFELRTIARSTNLVALRATVLKHNRL